MATGFVNAITASFEPVRHFPEAGAARDIAALADRGGIYRMTEPVPLSAPVLPARVIAAAPLHVAT